MQKEQTKKERCKMKAMSDSLEVVDAMQANEISPLEGWRALKCTYAMISPGDLLMDYKCTLAYMDYWEEMTPYPVLYSPKDADPDLVILPEHIFFSAGWKPIHETKKS